MNINQVIAIIGAIPLFAVRTFFPAFLTALFLAHPEWFSFINYESEIVAESSFWAQHWLVIVLGILSILEFISDKNSSLRIFLHEAEPYMKPIAYLLIQIFALSQQNTEVLTIQWSALILDYNRIIVLLLCMFCKN